MAVKSLKYLRCSPAGAQCGVMTLGKGGIYTFTPKAACKGTLPNVIKNPANPATNLPPNGLSCECHVVWTLKLKPNGKNADGYLDGAEQWTKVKNGKLDAALTDANQKTLLAGGWTPDCFCLVVDTNHNAIEDAVGTAALQPKPAAAPAPAVNKPKKEGADSKDGEAGDQPKK